MPTAIAEHAALLVRQHGPSALVAAVEQLYARLNDGAPVSDSRELAVLIAVEQLLDRRAKASRRFFDETLPDTAMRDGATGFDPVPNH